MALIKEPQQGPSTSTTSDEVSKGTRRRALVAAGIGNFIEWCDFVVYGFRERSGDYYLVTMPFEYMVDCGRG